MVKAHYDIISDETLLESSAQLQILAVMAPRYMTYIVFDADKQNIALMKQFQLDFFPDKSIEENLKDLLDTDENLRKVYQKSFIVYDYPSAGLMPEELFNVNMNKSITELMYGDVEKGLLLSERVMQGKMYNVYRIPRHIHTQLQQRFGSGNYWHIHTLFLEKHPTMKAFPVQMELSFKEDSIQVGVWKNDTLLLLQQYQTETLEDVIYYLQLIVHQLGLHPMEIQLVWSGKNKFIDEVEVNLNKYFKQVSPLPLVEGWSLGEAFDQSSIHYFTNYLNLVACV